MEKKKRLFVSVTSEIHAEVKARAARRHILMGAWIMRALLIQIRKEREEEQQ